MELMGAGGWGLEGVMSLRVTASGKVNSLPLLLVRATLIKSRGSFNKPWREEGLL